MKRNLCLLMVATGLFSLTANVTPAVADVTEVVLQPGETQVFTFTPDVRVWDPNFWIHFHTSAHVHIRQHLRAWGHWSLEELEWAHFHADYILPPGVCTGGSTPGADCTTDGDCPDDIGTCPVDVCVGGITPDADCTADEDCPDSIGRCSDSRVEIENIGTDPVEFDSVMNTVCVGGGANDGEPCMTSADCPDGSCSAALCREGGNDGNPCPNGNVDCPDGTCDVNAVTLAGVGTCVDNACVGGGNADGSCTTDDDCPGEMLSTPMVGPLDASLPVDCPDCLPRIVNFWHWDWERSIVAAWLELRYWSITDFHFAIDESWHMDTDGIATGVDGSFTGEYSIEITNNGTSPVSFTCDSNLLFLNIPAVSDWGLVAMTLLVLTAATVLLLRRRAGLQEGNLSA